MKLKIDKKLAINVVYALGTIGVAVLGLVKSKGDLEETVAKQLAAKDK